MLWTKFSLPSNSYYFSLPPASLYILTTTFNYLYLAIFTEIKQMLHRSPVLSEHRPSPDVHPQKQQNQSRSTHIHNIMTPYKQLRQLDHPPPRPPSTCGEPTTDADPSVVPVTHGSLSHTTYVMVVEALTGNRGVECLAEALRKHVEMMRVVLGNAMTRPSLDVLHQTPKCAEG